MRLNKTFAGAAIATAALLMASAASASVTVSSFAQGWVNSFGQGNGAVDDNNTFTGNENGARYNSWAAFYIPTGVFTSADLEILASPYGVASPNQVNMYSVTTAYGALQNGTVGVAIYDDLGAGSLYGFANILDGLTTTHLGGTALADINAAAGSIFIVGFTNATLNLQDPNNVDLGVYTNGNEPDHPVLTLDTTAAVPEPATWAMMITGFGLAGATLRRRRSALAAA
jgi:hypothetical protein